MLPKTRNIPYWYCLQWTPSLTLLPSSLKCLQKSNPNIHRKCFRCFKCFGCFRCFISLLDHKTAHFWSKSEQTRKTGTRPPPPKMGASNSQKGNSPTCLHTQSCPASGRRVFFGGADLFFAKRLFFRNGEGGEWRASRVTVGVMAKDNGGACFPLDFGITPTIGRQPSPPHRGDFLFFSIHPKHTSKAYI